MQTRDYILCGLFAALMAIMAQISVPLPFSPVPITGQTFGVFLVGGILGSRHGAVSMLVYMIMGAVGLPVFHHAQGGLHIVLGPTGGYLWGFVVGVYLLGKVVEKKSTYGTTVLGMGLCLLAVYALGVLQLSFITGLMLPQALMIGAVPFLPLDVVKLFAAAGLSLAIRQQLLKAGLLPSA